MKLFTQRAITMAAKAIVPCLVLLNGQANAQSLTSDKTPFSVASEKNSQQKLPDNVSPNWFEQATAYVDQYEHRFQPMNEYGVFKSVSSEQHLSFLLNAGGYTVQNVRSSETQSAWATSFSIKGAGRQHFGWTPVSDFNVVTEANKLVYSYSDVDVEYSNTKEGIRQNFVIRKNFDGKGNLVVKMGINSDLNAVLVNQQKLVFTANGAKESALNYEDLKVWDAKGTILSAHMEISADAKELSIVVNDSKAVYPVTIDPLNTTPTWSTSADDLIPTLLNNLALQVSTLYGYSVAGLGDVNGDGYDDVAVGAPGMVDVIVGTGLANVGGVFVYFGSPAGLPAAPSKILHPTTAVAGALFGYSIAAGDVTGDGINDIIVGSPLDGISLDFGSGGVNGQVGKVYVFQGGSLSGTYPTPFLNVSLNTSLLSATTIALKPLYGLAVAAVDDMNGDGKGEILVGAPLYAEIGAAAIKTGGAFLHLSDGGNTFSTVRALRPQNGSLLGLATPVENLVKALPLGNTLWLVAGPLLTPVLNGPIDGLLFGFSVSGAGKFDNDNLNDIVVGAPGGVNLASLGGGLGLVTAITDVLTGQILGGSAYVFNGTGNATGVNTAVTTRLQANASGLLGSAANLFGYSVLGGKTASKSRDGRIIVGAPSGAVLSNIVGGLQVKAGEIHIFKKRTAAVSSPVVSDQTVSSPRSSSILSILTGQPINMSILFGSSIDNLYDINCDGIGDLIVGEPLSSSVGLLNANALGGAAHAYFGRADGTYQAAPVWTGTTTISPLLGVNATALFGHAVAGAGHIKGTTDRVQMLVGGPSNSLDFGAGLLNLGNTLAVLNSFAFDNNGLGKAHTFDAAICNPVMLPVTITEFTGREEAKTVVLTWKTELEENIKCYELQKSVDGTNFSKIGIEFPKSKSLSNTYSNTDKHPVNGVNYYRLLIRNNDGKISYSNIISFKFGGSLAGDMVVAPNPVKQTIRIRFSNIETGNYRMEIRNATGQLFNSKQISINQSEQVAMIDRNNNMNTGIYWLTIYDNSHSRVKTVKMLVE